jgi:hypothetical protein
MLKEKIRRIKLSRLPVEEQLFHNITEGMQSYTPYKGYKFIYYYKDDTILFGYDLVNNKISYNRDIFYKDNNSSVFVYKKTLNELSDLVRKFGPFNIILDHSFGKFMSFKELKIELLKKKYSLSRYFLRNYYDKRKNKTD